MDLESAQNNVVVKLPLFKQGDYEMWKLRINQYFQVQDYALWDVIENGNSCDPVPRITANADGTSTSIISGPVIAKEKARKKNNVKARSMLLMALPNEHLLLFSQYKDAKTLFKAIQARFVGNDATKKHKTLLKQMYENFNAPSTESLDSIFNRLQKIVSQLAILEVKRIVVSSSSSGSPNMAFLSSPDNTNEDDTASIQVSAASTPVSTVSSPNNTDNLSDAIVYAFLANQPNRYQLVHEDLEQIHEDDLEEMELKWQLALLSMRARRYFQRTGKKITINGSDTVGPRNQESSRKTMIVEDTSSKAMLAIDGAGFDWSYMPDDEVPTNRLLWLSQTQRNFALTVVLTKFGIVPFSTARQIPYGAVAPGDPQAALRDTGIFDSGCLQHMRGNKSFLSDYQEYDGGFVAFAGSSKGGKITGLKIHSDAGQEGKEKVSDQEYILLPVLNSSLDVPSSNEEVLSSPKDDAGKKSTVEPTCIEGGKIDDLECLDQQKKSVDDNENTNSINTVSPTVNTASDKDGTFQRTYGKWNFLTLITVNIVGSSFSHPAALDDFSKMPKLEDTRIFDDAYDDRDEGAEADKNNMEQNKRDHRGIVVRNKARLVAQGHRQEECIDYDEFFALVARIKAIRLFLAYASFMDFTVYQNDVKSAFLYRTIKEEVYVSQPPGFMDPEFPYRVYKVEKALYALHQAPRAWYETLSNYLLENGFKRGTIDKTLFIKKIKNDILLVQVYVDDIIFGSIKRSLSTEFKQLIHNRFQMTSIGELTFFLGLQVEQRKDCIFLSQDKYACDILKKFGFSSVKLASTPMETHKPLSKDSDGTDVDVHLYRSMIGSLMYLTSFRPDIMFAVLHAQDFKFNQKFLICMQ
nr:copia protein [Tanacetum cinerariifolium]